MYNQDGSTTLPSFDQSEVQTHDLQIAEMYHPWSGGHGFELSMMSWRFGG